VDIRTSTPPRPMAPSSTASPAPAPASRTNSRTGGPARARDSRADVKRPSAARFYRGRCSAGLETVAYSESGRWLCHEADGEWRRCEHLGGRPVLEQRRARAGRGR
jgi:hypothetical protein